KGQIMQRHFKAVWRPLPWILIITLILSGCGGIGKSKQYKVGIFLGVESVVPVGEGFKAAMADLGYVEGENIVYDVQVTNFDLEKYQTILKKFIADDVDLIFVAPTDATIEAKKIVAGTDIPVVFSFAFTEGMGIIDSVREPGGNITGVRFPGVDITLKRYSMMRAIAPDAKRIWLPYQRGYPIVPPQLEALKPLAEADGVTLIEFPADNAAEVQAELEKRAAADDIGMDAILGLVEPLTVTPDAFTVIVKFAYDYKLPFGGRYNTSGEYSALFGVNADLFKCGRLAAPLADKVLKGTPAGTIPVVSPENFIQVDYRVAQQFGLIIPESILEQADEIIK
ncbi:MAG: ABC transporter substrate-binding protein, partial [Chloroflexota bacterium]|nr:ABC transporter substrate-binding protein [Anaerolineales bacterium]